MDILMKSNCTKELAKKYENIYTEELNTYGQVSTDTKFNYAWSLIESNNEINIKLALQLLEDLYRSTNEEKLKRDYLYYLAIGNTKIKSYNTALKFTDALLTIEPTNTQVLDLKEFIMSKLKSDGLIGLAIAGTGTLILGGAIAIAAKLLKR